MNTLSCTELIRMGRHIPTPFHLLLSQEHRQLDLTIETILRIVPGKRIIAVTRWKHKQVIVKIFFQPGHWKRNLLRDLKGINLLTQSSIRTPKILHQTTTADNMGAVLIIEYLQQGASLGSLFDEARSEHEKDDILEMAIQNIARCHQSGLWQRDIHLGNFMLSQGRVYLLDGGAIYSAADKLDVEIRLGNLAMFFAQFPVAIESRVPALLQSYQEQTADLSASELSQFASRIKKAREQRLSNYERKLFRSTSAHRCEHDATKFLVYDRAIHSSDLEKFIEDPDSFIDNGKMLKEGNSSTVAEVTIGDRTYVVKRYNIKNFLHGMTRMFRPSRAHHSWRNASILEMLGITIPHPYLFMEERVLWLFRRRAYFLCEKIAADNLTVSMEKDNSLEDVADELATAFGGLFKVMNEYRISHGDMKATNFIFKDKCLYVLDLDAMRRHKLARIYSAKISKDLTRFRKNWEGTTFESPINGMIREIEAIQTG